MTTVACIAHRGFQQTIPSVQALVPLPQVPRLLIQAHEHWDELIEFKPALTAVASDHENLISGQGRTATG